MPAKKQLLALQSLETDMVDVKISFSKEKKTKILKTILVFKNSLLQWVIYSNMKQCCECQLQYDSEP